MKTTSLQRYLLWICLVTGTANIAVAQNITVQGRVTAHDAGPVPGVSVVVDGTSTGTVTDEKGAYKLAGVPPSARLVFSTIGFKKEVVTVNNRTSINVNLQPEVSNLEQVVVIGYGTATKKDLTGAVASINATQLENENPASVQDVLRGNLPGVNVGYTTSAKGGGDLQIRGKNTLKAGSSPLIVLDGVIYYGTLDDINPNDIETIDVLKDASSAAVYGAKSASGVILVTTKKGRPGKPVINVNANVGIATLSRNQRPYSPEGFVSWREDVKKSTNVNAKPYQFSDPRKLPSDVTLEQWFAYDNANPAADPATIWLQRLGMQPVEIDNYKAGKSVDWYDQVFQTALRQDYTVSISGKKEEISYYWSLGYMNNDGVVVGDKYNVVRSRLNLEGKIANFLTVGTNTQFSVRDESQVPVDWKLFRINSPWGSFYTDDSSGYRYSPNDDPGAGSRNPFNVPKYTERLRKYWTLNSSIYAKVSLPFGITYQLNFTPRFEWYQNFNHQSSAYQDWAPQGGIAVRENRQLYQWQVDNLIKWSKTFNQVHHIDVTLLANAEKYQVWRSRITNNGFDPNDNLGFHDIGSGINPILQNIADYGDETGAGGDEYSTADALMARLYYAYKERYLLTLSVRRDGYSAFGQSNPRATFPSAAFAWVFTEEPFFKAKWLNYGKLRLSYGINGNRDIGRYVALSDLQTGKYLHVLPDGTVVQASQLYVNRMRNLNLKWEKTTAFNVGLDFSLFNDIIGGSIDLYQSKTTDLLVQRFLPDVIGFDNVWDNLGEVSNKGLEINLNSLNINQNNFTWRTGFNFSLNRNKIVHLYGDLVDIKDANGKVIGQKEPDDITNKWFIGQPSDVIWDIPVLGVYQTNEAEEAKKYGKAPGDFKLKDVNNDGQYTNADREFLGYREPRFRWTLRNEFTILKNISFSFMMYSLWGHSTAFDLAKNRDGGFLDRVSSYVLPYWTPNNPINDWARLYSSDGSASYSVYRKRSFIRLDNVSVAYTFPKQLLRRANIENLKVYFTVKNGGVYTQEWSFWDPEWASGSEPGPTPRFFTLGLDLTL